MRTEHFKFNLVCMHCPIKFILSNGSLRGDDYEFLRNLFLNIIFSKPAFCDTAILRKCINFPKKVSNLTSYTSFCLAKAVVGC